MEQRSDITTTTRSIANTPYDTAWVAGLPDRSERRDPRFPSALNWISSNQYPDGSWGSAVPYLHDRMLCTLAALIPLARFGRRDSDRIQIRRGERYLWQNAHLLSRDACELVGFELLLPTLVRLAREAGVNVPPKMDAFRLERERKLAMLPTHLIYSRDTTIAHSLEFLGAEVNPLQLLSVRASNGSIGNSPAATAFLLHHIEDPAAVAYLEQCLATGNGDGVSVLDPCETFDALWVAYHLWAGGTPAAATMPAEVWADLAVELEGDGVSLSPSFPVPDADETAVALLLFHEAGRGAPFRALESFERDDYFVSFPFERHPSTGVNIHVLQMLLRYPDYPKRDAAIAKILHFLESERLHGTFWLDKWHASPHYATGRAIMALTDLHRAGITPRPDLLDPAIEWLLHTQCESGAWGFLGVETAEETAYASLALAYSGLKQPRVALAIEAATHYLEAHRDDEHPALWIDKCLYYPPRIVESAIEAALARGRSRVGLISPMSNTELPV